MIPILFPAEIEPERLLDCNAVLLNDVNAVELWASGNDDVRDFDTIGLGVLTDCISCSVTEERNGEYELTMEYPITGAHFSDIELRCIILAKPNYSDVPQAFRIYTMTTPIDGVVTIAARHLSYDLSGVPVLPFTATSAAAACQGLIDNAAIDTPFTVNTQVGTIADFKADVPASVRSWFGGKEGSLIDVYGGEWHYDNYVCTLKAQRGADRGVTIRYGVNLIDFEQEKNCEATYTGVLPYWADEEGNLVRANIINLDGTYEYRRILVLDLSMDFEEQPTTAQLTTRAESYITANKIGVPKVSITLDWVQISELSDRVELCDTVHVVFEKIGVETSAKIVRVVWDVLKDRYSELEIGEPKTNITDTIAGLEQETEKATSSVSTVMLGAIARATAAITGNSGGYVVLHDSDGDGNPDELLIMNTPDIETATKVWRWNQSGLGYSSSGVEGPFGLAMTSQGEIVADYITTGTLSAVDITLGGDNNQYGKLSVLDASGDVAIETDLGDLYLWNNGMLVSMGASATDYATFSSGVIRIVSGGSNAVSLYSGGGSVGNIEGGSDLDIHTSGYSARIYMSNNSVKFTGNVYAPYAYTTTQSGAANVIVNDGGLLVRSSSSSRRYKDHITTDLADLDPEVLYDLPVVRFRFKDGYISESDERYGKDVIGFIAEDVDELYPIAVRHEDGQAEMWESNYIIPAMMELIKRQKKQLDEQQTKIDELEARLSRLEARFFDDGR